MLLLDDTVMSSFNFLPTAVVSPVVPRPISEKTKQQKSDINLSSKKHRFENSINDVRNHSFVASNLSSGMSSLCSTESDCQNSVKKLKLSSCTNSTYSPMSNCTVELTKFKHLGKEFDQSKKLKPNNCNKLANTMSTNVNNNADTDSDDDISLQRWRQQNLNKKVTQCSKEKVYKHKTRSTTKQIPQKNAPILESRKGYETVHAVASKYNDDSLQTQTSNFLSYVPKISEILQKFPSNMAVCSLCHLPANFLPQLGDLFGPYRPSCNEVIDRYKVLQNQFPRTDVNVNSSSTSIKNVSILHCYSMK